MYYIILPSCAALGKTTSSEDDTKAGNRLPALVAANVDLAVAEARKALAANVGCRGHPVLDEARFRDRRRTSRQGEWILRVLLAHETGLERRAVDVEIVGCGIVWDIAGIGDREDAVLD